MAELQDFGSFGNSKGSGGGWNNSPLSLMLKPHGDPLGEALPPPDYSQPGMAGGPFDFYEGPRMARQFLDTEMAPGGFLSRGNASMEAARGLRGIVEGGQREYRSAINAMGASGLNRRYAGAAAGSVRHRTSAQANTYLTEIEGRQTQRRFDAQRSYLNMLNQSSIASKQSYVNYLMARMGASATIQGGQAAGKGSALGGLLGAFGAIAGAII